MRYFNTSGPCVPELHYMLPPEPLPGAQDLIDEGLYFVIFGRRPGTVERGLNPLFSRARTPAGRDVTLLRA